MLCDFEKGLRNAAIGVFGGSIHGERFHFNQCIMKQIRKKKGLAFQFQKPAKVSTEYQPVPMSDTAKEVVRLSLHHWNSNVKGLKQRNKLRTYIQGTIWGRIGKNFSAKTFEEWHVIVMTKKLYDKREELRAIFGRDCVKRIFKCWVDHVFEEVEAPKLL